MTQHYPVHVVCHNCGLDASIAYPAGKEVKLNIDGFVASPDYVFDIEAGWWGSYKLAEKGHAIKCSHCGFAKLKVNV